jgi:hypothetical protein
LQACIKNISRNYKKSIATLQVFWYKWGMLIEEIRKQIKTCGKTRYQISQDTGIEQSALCRIMQGKTCTLEMADKLLKYFGVELKKRGKK